MKRPSSATTTSPKSAVGVADNIRVAIRLRSHPHTMGEEKRPMVEILNATDVRVTVMSDPTVRECGITQFFAFSSAGFPAIYRFLENEFEFEFLNFSP